MFDVVGLGVATLDILALVNHMPAEEEVLLAQEITIQGGGPVATALVALSRLGAKAVLMDAQGDDWRGEMIRKGLEAEGVSTEFVQTRRGHSSAVACLLVKQPEGSRTIVFQPGSAPEIQPGELQVEAIQAARILHLNGRHWQASLRAVELARAAGARVSFDGGAGRFREALRQLVPRCDICIVAREFAQKYTQAEQMEEMGKRLLQEGPELVVVTAGSEGSWIFSQAGKRFHQPAFRMAQVVDTTGCGDAYHGAFLFGLLRGYALEKTAEFASAVAALNTQGLGGRTALPRLERVEAFLRSAL